MGWSRLGSVLGTRKLAWLLLAVSSSSVLGGCGRPSDGSLVPVTGQVFARQTPAAGALVVLHPVGGSSPESWSHGLPHAIVDADGTFRVTLQPLGDGAPAGEYKVVITWPTLLPNGSPEAEEPETFDRLEGRWADPNRTALTAKVEAPRTVLPRFELD